MPIPFKGTINIDIKDSTPDWAPYSQPEARDGRYAGVERKPSR
jgi:hypothetical protein